MNLILLGYRGSGKTSVGRLLAARLDLVFVDGDDETRRRFDGLAIADIWQRYGEPRFRQVEAEAVADLCRRGGQVISLGGGALMHPDGRLAVMRARALRVYLQCEPEELHRRIHADDATGTARPALTALGGSVQEIRNVLVQREPTYRATADLTVDVTNLSVEHAASYIEQHWRRKFTDA